MFRKRRTGRRVEIVQLSETAALTTIANAVVTHDTVFPFENLMGVADRVSKAVTLIKHHVFFDGTMFTTQAANSQLGIAVADCLYVEPNVQGQATPHAGSAWLFQNEWETTISRQLWPDRMLYRRLGILPIPNLGSHALAQNWNFHPRIVKRKVRMLPNDSLIHRVEISNPNNVAVGTFTYVFMSVIAYVVTT